VDRTYRRSVHEVLQSGGIPVFNDMEHLESFEPEAERKIATTIAVWLQDPRVTGLHRIVALYTRHSLSLSFRLREVKAGPTQSNRESFLACIENCRHLIGELSKLGHLPYLSDVSMVSVILPGYALFQVRGFTEPVRVAEEAEADFHSSDMRFRRTNSSGFRPSCGTSLASRWMAATPIRATLLRTSFGHTNVFKRSFAEPEAQGSRPSS
jgi:hypothetical protein